MKKSANHYQSRDCDHCTNILPFSDSNNQESRANFSYSSHNCQNKRLARLSAAIEPPQALKEAVKRLSATKHQQVRQWVEELNAQRQVAA